MILLLSSGILAGQPGKKKRDIPDADMPLDDSVYMARK
jgi:hypothetical protein